MKLYRCGGVFAELVFMHWKTAQYVKKHVAASPDPVSLGMPSVRGRVLALGICHGLSLFVKPSLARSTTLLAVS